AAGADVPSRAVGHASSGGDGSADLCASRAAVAAVAALGAIDAEDVVVERDLAARQVQAAAASVATRAASAADAGWETEKCGGAVGGKSVVEGAVVAVAEVGVDDVRAVEEHR